MARAPRYEIRLSPVAKAQLNALRAFDHVRILEAVEQQLGRDALVRTRRRKPLHFVPPILEAAARTVLQDVDTLWELRVVPWRVAYAVEGRSVQVLSVFRKDRQTMNEALS